MAGKNRCARSRRQCPCPISRRPHAPRPQHRARRDDARLVGRWLYDYENQRTLETLAGAEWRNCCWKIRLLSQRELTDEDGDTTLEADTTVLLQIQMTGLGGFGGRVDSLLERSIPGYRSEYD